VQFLQGRFNFSLAAPNLLVPEPTDSADTIFARMGDAGFSPNEVADLLTSHTVAGADDIDVTIPVSLTACCTVDLC
jgi:cytochrome c peroxidase